MMRIGIVDYGVGNIGSVFRAIEDLGACPVAVSEPKTPSSLDRLILPGVGSFTECMNILDRGGWTAFLKESVISRRCPILGICLGMQLLADYGSEGATSDAMTRGLGFLPGYVTSMRDLGCKERLPHVGWNSVDIRNESRLFDGLKSGTDFYFVHSYSFVANEDADVIATVNYGSDFCAVVGRGIVHGVQFHPEKSSKAGMRILRNFVQGELC